MFGATAFVFPRHRYARRSPAFPEMAERLPANGKQRMNSLFCFACALPIKLPLSQPRSFFTHSSDSLPHPTRGGEHVSGCVALGRRLGLNHESNLDKVLKKNKQKLKTERQVPLATEAESQQGR